MHDREPSSRSTETAIKANKELHGVVISYFVRVRCWVGISRFSVHVPFLLMQPEKELSTINNNSNNNDIRLTTHTVQADVVENQYMMILEMILLTWNPQGQRKKRKTKEHITPGNENRHEKIERELDGTRKEGTGQSGLENAGQRPILH
ncbi:unnamed protein product [Schistosoma margrebowiei]|uniref:Uncharacterized protein n=1 Tax=Schistosoma margrebowiei TaxID=48269 RepID=A0A183LL39_9TREM|nr:unnamed protein product [Schistosoma margrebowiei]